MSDPTREAGEQRGVIERAARVQDALDALDLATLWLHRTLDLPPMPSHQAGSWERKARSGRIAIRAALSTTPAQLDVERLAAALHGTGTDLTAESWTWGTCTNWEPGWGDECGPDKHLDEATNILRRAREYAKP